MCVSGILGNIRPFWNSSGLIFIISLLDVFESAVLGALLIPLHDLWCTLIKECNEYALKNILIAHLYSVWKECSGTLGARNQLLNMSLPDSSEAVSRVLLFCNNSLFYTNCFNNLEEINTNLRLGEQKFFFVSTLKLDNQHQLKNLLLMRKEKGSTVL